MGSKCRYPQPQDSGNNNRTFRYRPPSLVPRILCSPSFLPRDLSLPTIRILEYIGILNVIIKRRPGSRPPREMVKATQVGMFIQAPSSIFPRARELPAQRKGLLSWAGYPAGVWKSMQAPSCGLFGVCDNGKGKNRWVLSNSSGFSPVWQENVLGRPDLHEGTITVPEVGVWLHQNSFLPWTQEPSSRLSGNCLQCMDFQS